MTDKRKKEILTLADNALYQHIIGGINDFMDNRHVNKTLEYYANKLNLDYNEVRKVYNDRLKYYKDAFIGMNLETN